MTFRQYGGTEYAPKHNYTKLKIQSLNRVNVGTGGLHTPFINNIANNTWSINSDGHIYCTGTSTMSDYRIKTNVSYNFKYSVDNIKPVSYYNKLTKKDECGVLAHELQEIYPNLVSGIKDDAIQYQTVNYISLVAILIKEVQEIKRENAHLKKQMQTIHESILEMNTIK